MRVVSLSLLLLSGCSKPWTEQCVDDALRHSEPAQSRYMQLCEDRAKLQDTIERSF